MNIEETIQTINSLSFEKRLNKIIKIVDDLISLNFHVNSKYDELIAFHDELDRMRNNVNEPELERIRLRIHALILDVKNGNH